MKTLKTIIKWLLVGILVIILLVVTPIIPTAFFDNHDPTSTQEERVTAPISNDDLKDILNEARGGYLLSVIDILSIEPYHEILYIAETKAYYTSNGGEMKKHPPKGKVIVSIGFICGSLCGHGVDFYFDKIDGKWVILETSHWIA